MRASSISVSLSLSLSLSRLWAELLKKKNSLLCTGLWCLPFNSPNPATTTGPRGVPHILAECGALKMRGAGRAPARTVAANVSPVAFRAALGECLGSSTLIVAVFSHPTDAAGTNGDFEGETTSIVASFDFHPLKTRELSQIPAR